MKFYPRMVGLNRLPAVPYCCVCGQVAKWWVSVQVSYFRGDDLIANVCDDHKGQKNSQSIIDSTLGKLEQKA